jgi:hypothetical protein
MTSELLIIGDAFLLSTPPNGNHLFIVIALTNNGNYLCVNATTRRYNSDKSCVLTPGLGVPDFIVHESVIAYKHAREISPAKILELIKSNQVTRQGCCSMDILKKIQQGALISRQIPNKYKQILKEFLCSSQSS